MELEWIKIPAGYFKSGTDELSRRWLVKYIGEYAQYLEALEKTVFLPSYMITKYLITQGQFEEFVVSTGYSAYPRIVGLNDSTADHPVRFITFLDALHFCTWAGVRLPTEMEWEKSAKGPSNSVYPWGNDWQSGLCNTREHGIFTTSPVDYFPNGRSEYGVMDMSGNVWEYTLSTFVTNSDIHFAAYEHDSDTLSANHTFDFYEDFREYLCIKGGSAKNNKLSARCTAKSGISLSYPPNDLIGFRCVKPV